MNERSEEIKKENRKAFLPFIVVLVAATICGGFVGGFSNMYQGSLQSVLGECLTNLMTAITPYAMAVAGVLLLGSAFIIYYQCNRKFKARGSEDEVLEELEYKLNYPLMLTSICMIVDYFFLPAIIIFSVKGQGNTSYIPDFIGLASFFISLILVIWIQKKVVDLEKKINPEKNGSIFDMKFAKKWEASCDEAERLNIYKAAYVAYQSTSKVIIAVWLILVLASLYFDIGMIPIAAVTVIWLVQTVTYCRAAMKLEKKK